MAASVNDKPIDRKLDEIFEEAYHMFDEFDNCMEATNSTEVQVRIHGQRISFAVGNNQTNLFFFCLFRKKSNKTLVYSRKLQN